MLLRRLRYMITGRMIRFLTLAIFFLVILLIICLFAFGVFNQKDIISWAVNGTINMGQNVEEHIKEGNTGQVSVTSEGVYVEGYEPEDAEEITSGGIVDAFFDLIHSVNDQVNGDEDSLDTKEESEDKSKDESKDETKSDEKENNKSESEE